MNEALRIRRAAPGDADALSRLARSVAAEPGGWLLTLGTWRSSSEAGGRSSKERRER